MSTELEMAAVQSTALVPTISDAERRVQQAKARLSSHLAVFEERARFLARQSAWVAGMVLLGVVGAAAAAAMFRSPRRPKPLYYAGESGRGGVGTALMLAAFGLLTRGARSLAAQRIRSM